MHSYCLFCDTQRCGVIAELLERCGVDRAFSPKLVGRERKQGVLLEKRYDLLPGYVFLFTQQALPDLREYRWIDGLIRYVGRAEDQYELTGGDRSFADALFEQDGILRPLTLVREGERVSLRESVFAGARGEVIRVDLKRQRAKVAFVFDGLPFSTWVAVDQLRL